MARKKRKTNMEDMPRLVPHEDLVRKTFATALIQDGALIDLMARDIEAINNMDGVRAFSGKEHQFLEEAIESLRRAEKICFVIGRRNQRARS